MNLAPPRETFEEAAHVYATKKGIKWIRKCKSFLVRRNVNKDALLSEYGKSQN